MKIILEKSAKTDTFLKYWKRPNIEHRHALFMIRVFKYVSSYYQGDGSPYVTKVGQVVYGLVCSRKDLGSAVARRG